MLFTYNPNKKKEPRKKLKNNKHKIRKDRLVRQQRVFLTTPNSKGGLMERRKLKNSLITTALILVVAGALLMIFLPVFKIQSVHIEIEDSLVASAAEENIWSQLDQKWLGFIPQSNIWLVNRSKISDTLTNDMPGINSVHIEKHLPNNLRIKLEMREPVLVWSTAGKYYYADQNGMIFAEVLRSEITNSTIPFVHDESNTTLELKSHVITRENIEYIEIISAKLVENYGYVITMYSMPSAMAPDIEIHISEGWSILVDPRDSISLQLQTFDTLMKEEIGSKKTRLAYIDMRALELVTYKIR